MKRILLAVLACVSVHATAASAADVMDESTFDWTGLYVGANAGYAFGGEDDVGISPRIGGVGDLELNGIFGGLGVGYNYQIDQIVLGVEGDIQLSGISDSDSNGLYDTENDVNYFGTLRGRAGWAFDQTLLYATGGLAFGDFDYEVKGGNVSIDDNFSNWGYVVGAGVEQAIDENLSIKAEYLYANFGEEDLEEGGFTTHATPDFHLARIGVNYRF